MQCNFLSRTSLKIKMVMTSFDLWQKLMGLVNESVTNIDFSLMCLVASKVIMVNSLQSVSENGTSHPRKKYIWRSKNSYTRIIGTVEYFLK